jgi:RNA polymerase sigma-70 factor, ECF subfamily
MEVAVATTEIDEDRALVDSARAGDRAAFNRLIVQYQHRIVGLCCGMLEDPVEGQDAAQEAFVKAYRALGRFKGDSRFSTWLYRIAVNTCRNRRRSWWSRLRSRAVRVDHGETRDGEESRPVQLADTRMSPDKDLERHRIVAHVRKALSTLPPIHRELILLRDVQGLSYEEIEAAVGVSLGTVKSRLARAREAMRKELAGVVDGL